MCITEESIEEEKDVVDIGIVAVETSTGDVLFSQIRCLVIQKFKKVNIQWKILRMVLARQGCFRPSVCSKMYHRQRLYSALIGTTSIAMHLAILQKITALCGADTP